MYRDRSHRVSTLGYCSPESVQRISGCLCVATAAWLSCFNAHVRAGIVIFNPSVTYQCSGSLPEDSAVGDFNHDGHLDIAITSNGGVTGSGQLSVLLGDGQGHFQNAGPMNLAILPWGIAAADFNADGNLDLAVTDGQHDSTRVLILVGNGLGGFSVASTADAGKFPVSVVAGDFNEDGKLDLAVANNALNGVSIVLGNGNGTFNPPIHLPGQSALAATDIATADFNNDGHRDLAVSHFGGVRVFLGAGNGSFAVSADISTASNEAVAVGDFNRDGKMDIVSIELYGERLLLSISNGNGTFRPAQPFGVGFFAEDLAVADLDRDSLPDVIVADMNEDHVGILLNDGSGGLQAELPFITSFQPASLAIGDWNEDSWPDLAVPCQNLGNTTLASVLIQVSHIKGDMNCDGVVNLLDLNAFVTAILDQAAFVAANPGCHLENADFTNEGLYDGRDVRMMVARLRQP